MSIPTIAELIERERDFWSHLPKEAFQVISAACDEYHAHVIYSVKREGYTSVRMTNAGADGSGWYSTTLVNRMTK